MLSVGSMHLFFVFFELTVVIEAGATLVTDPVFVMQMGYHVLVEVGFLTESFLADVAPVRLFICVEKHVNVEVCGIVEPLATHLAHTVPLSSVSLCVLPQVGDGQEHFGACPASIVLLSWEPLPMFSEFVKIQAFRGFECEGANIAQEFFLRVRPSVRLPSPATLQHLQAHLTLTTHWTSRRWNQMYCAIMLPQQVVIHK
jgi:hypothetical protein